MKTTLLASVALVAMLVASDANAFVTGQPSPGQPQGAYTPQNSNSPHHGGSGDICASCHYYPPTGEYFKGTPVGYGGTSTPLGGNGGVNGFGGRALH